MRYLIPLITSEFQILYNLSSCSQPFYSFVLGVCCVFDDDLISEGFASNFGALCIHEAKAYSFEVVFLPWAV